MPFKWPTPEEMKNMSAEELKKLQDQIDSEYDQKDSDLQTSEIRREAAERLMENPRRPSNRGNGRTPTNDNTNDKKEEDLTDEIKREVRAILSKYDAEDLNDASVLRKLLGEFGEQVVQIAFQKATGQALAVMDRVLTTNANLQSIINKWRDDNPDLVEHEEIVEFFLIKRTDVNKPLQERIEDATEKARKHLGIVRDEGRNEERRNATRTREIRTLTPNSRGGGRPPSPPEKPATHTFSDEENQKDLQSYLAGRNKWRQGRMAGTGGGKKPT